MKKYERRLRLNRKFLYLMIVLVPALGILGITGEVLVRRLYPVACLNLRLDEVPFEASAMLRHVWERGGDQVRVRKNSMLINTLGYRGPEFSASKPEGTYRIIIYGGSQVFDMNVGGLDDWPHLMGRTLRAKGAENIEIVNAGVLGNVSWEASAWLLGEGHRFRPDMVLLCNEWNELTYLSSSEDLVRHFGPFDRRDNPQMYSVNALDRFLSRYSCLYRGLRYEFLGWKMNLGAEGSRRGTKGEIQLQDRAFEQYRLNLLEFVDLARRIGAEPAFIVQPRLPVGGASAEARAKINYEVHHLSHDQICEAFKRMDEILRDIALRENLVLLKSGKVLSGRAEYFEDHIHFNENGSRKFAELMATELGNFMAGRDVEAEPAAE